jgi:dihydroorotase-like cyclic amidohydrolase
MITLEDIAKKAGVSNGLIFNHFKTRDGLIQTVATDHAPFDFADQKHMGANDFTKIPNGIPSLEERVKLLYSRGVLTGKIDLHTFVNVASTAAANATQVAVCKRNPYACSVRPDQ